MRRAARIVLIATSFLAAALAGAAIGIVQDHCGPFTDVSPALCPYVAEMYYLGITAGTSATTYSPDATMTRGQAAVFVSKGVGQALARSSRRAALGQWWTTGLEGIGFTPLADRATGVVSDGADLWVSVGQSGVVRVRGSDGRIVETRTVPGASSLLAAMGRVFVSSNGALYMLDPATPGAVQTVASDASLQFGLLAFDGSRIWALSWPDKISILTPSSSTPWPITTVAGLSTVAGISFDGTSMWVTASDPHRLMRLDSAGTVVQTVPLTSYPGQPVFDGSNLWIPITFPGLGFHRIDVVQASTGILLETLTASGGLYPFSAAFDGRRILVAGVGGLSLWDAASLTSIAVLEPVLVNGLTPEFVCSDGINFWIALADTGGGGGGGSPGRAPEVVGGLGRF